MGTSILRQPPPHCTEVPKQLLLYSMGPRRQPEVSSGLGNIGSFTPGWRPLTGPISLLKSIPAILLVQKQRALWEDPGDRIWWQSLLLSPPALGLNCSNSCPSPTQFHLPCPGMTPHPWWDTHPGASCWLSHLHEGPAPTGTCLPTGAVPLLAAVARLTACFQ